MARFICYSLTAILIYMWPLTVNTPTVFFIAGDAGGMNASPKNIVPMKLAALLSYPHLAAANVASSTSVQLVKNRCTSNSPCISA